MDENSRVYKIIAIMNKLSKMNDEFIKMGDEVRKLFRHLEEEERVVLTRLVLPDYALSDLEEGGIGEFWAESIHVYDVVDLDGLED